jgi:hypothetical protein
VKRCSMAKRKKRPPALSAEEDTFPPDHPALTPAVLTWGAFKSFVEKNGVHDDSPMSALRSWLMMVGLDPKPPGKRRR